MKHPIHQRNSTRNMLRVIDIRYLTLHGTSRIFLSNPRHLFPSHQSFWASFRASPPYKSDNKLQKPLKLHQRRSGREPDLFQPLQKLRPSTRPHPVPLAGQIHDVQPPQGWHPKFLRHIAEWINPLNIAQPVKDAMIVVSDPAPTDLVNIRNLIHFFMQDFVHPPSITSTK